MDTKVISVCKLEDGREMEYDACNLISPDPDKWEYLGIGKIMRINGIEQKFKKIEFFYKKRRVMEKIQIDMTEDILRKGVENAINTIFKSEYSNPFFDIVKKAIEEQKPALDKFVSEIISNAISDANFKEKMGGLIIQKMVESILKK